MTPCRFNPNLTPYPFHHYEIVVFGWLFIQLLIAIKYTSVEIMTNALLVEFMFGVLLYFAHKYNFRITSFDFIISFILSIFFFFLGFKLAKDGPLAGWARVFTYGFGGMFFTYTFKDGNGIPMS